jgi:succinate dehydrogenase / fumarate reductase membrane anchor subunit
MLWLAMLHGTNGMRTVINDYTEHEGVRKTLVISLWGVCAALILLGTLVIFTFDPCPAGSPVDLLPSFCPAAIQ